MTQKDASAQACVDSHCRLGLQMTAFSYIRLQVYHICLVEYETRYKLSKEDMCLWQEINGEDATPETQVTVAR